jgi:hypothetical protein
MILVISKAQALISVPAQKGPAQKKTREQSNSL